MLASSQNFLMVKMAGRSFGREKNYGLTVTVSSTPVRRCCCCVMT
jgi:hypothetical protein